MEKDFWARARNIPDTWPVDEQGNREAAARLSVQWELDSMADITLSLLESCGIPAFKAGTQGKVLLGFAGLGVDIYVPQSRLEEAQAVLAADTSEEDSDTP